MFSRTIRRYAERRQEYLALTADASPNSREASDRASFATSDVKHTERYAYWRDLIRRTTSRTEFSSPRRDDLRSQMTVTELGPVRSVEIVGDEAAYSRSRR